MSFSVRNMRSATGMELCKGARPTAPVATWRRGNVVVQARYSYDEDTPSRRPSRPTRAWDDAPEQRRGGGRTPAQSWDEDFDAPSRMDRASRDGGAYRPRESGASGRGGRGGGGGGGRGYGGGFNRGPPRDYEGAEAGERQGGEDRGYGGGRGGRGGARGDRSGQGERRGYGRDALTSEQLSQRQALNQAIREASSWRDLASFVEEKGSVMDAENVASILFKLTGPRPGGRQGGRGSDQSYGSDFARPRDEAASAEYDRLLSTLLGWVLVLMPNFRPRQVTLTLQSLAKLELWNVEVVTALVAACIKQMGNLEPADYSNIMWSFAKFNYSPGQEFFDAYLTGSARKLGNMTPIDLAKLAVSMSKLGCIPTAEWAEAFWKASSDNVADMSEMSTGDVLMATAYFAQAGQQPPQQWVDKLFGHYVETEAERSVRAAALQASYQQQLNELARQQMTAADDAKLEALPPKPTLSERQLPRIQLINKMLYTLSNLSCKPSPAWFAAVVDAWRRQMQYCSASDVGNIALYLGRYLSVPVSTSMCGTLLREVTRGSNAQRFRGDDLAAIAYLLSASRFKGSEKEIDDFVYSLKQRLHECNLSSLELVYNALPSLGSGYRLNETVTEAANRYNDMAAQAAAAEQANAAAAAVATA